MTSYTPSGTRTAEQERWSNYYLTRDLDLASPALYLLGNPGRVPADSTVVDAVLPVGVHQETEYHPVDTRVRGMRTRNRRQYRKAKAYYGKTYIVPRAQLAWGVLIGFGSALAVGASAALAVLHAVV